MNETSKQYKDMAKENVAIYGFDILILSILYHTKSLKSKNNIYVICFVIRIDLY